MHVVEQVITLLRSIAQNEIMPRFLHVNSTRKHDGSPFTEADIASQYALSHALPHILPYPVLGEEMTPEQQLALWAENQDGLWVVDPIDGTTNFLHGFPYFAISVALMHHGQTELGIIYNPVSDEMFYARRGHGAYLNQLRLPLHHTPRTMSDSIAAIEIKYLRSGRLSTRLTSTAPFSSQRNLGASTLDWCYLAAGRFDLYLHGGQRLWDYAAGALILEEAGGMTSTLENDDYWQCQVWNRSVIAALDPTLYTCWHRWIRSNQ